MQINGLIKSISETQKVSDKFQKREFVVMTEYNTAYPQYIPFQFTQDKCALLDKCFEDQEVSVDFNMRGRQWTNPAGETKTFLTLEAWKIQPVNENQKKLSPEQEKNLDEMLAKLTPEEKTKLKIGLAKMQHQQQAQQQEGTVDENTSGITTSSDNNNNNDDLPF